MATDFTTEPLSSTSFGAPANLIINPYNWAGDSGGLETAPPVSNNGSYNGSNNSSYNGSYNGSNNSFVPECADCELIITKVLCVPSFILMIVSSALLILVIIRHLRVLLHLYISVLFYAFCQIVLLLVIVISWTLFGGRDTAESCQYKVTIQSISLVLPAYGLLFITTVRTIFVRRPLDNEHFLQKKYQAVAIFLIFLLCVGIFLLPHLGLCQILLAESGAGLQYCSYGTGTGACTAFYVVVGVVGYALPILSVFCLYMFIYSRVIAARRNNVRLTSRCSTTYSSVKSESNDTTRKVRRGKCDEESATRKVRYSIPWCIPAILALYFVSTLPWVPMELMTGRVIEMLAEGGYGNVAFDVMYSVMLMCTAVSPLMYLLTSEAMRGLVWRDFKQCATFILCKG